MPSLNKYDSIILPKINAFPLLYLVMLCFTIASCKKTKKSDPPMKHIIILMVLDSTDNSPVTIDSSAKYRFAYSTKEGLADHDITVREYGQVSIPTNEPIYLTEIDVGGL